MAEELYYAIDNAEAAIADGNYDEALEYLGAVSNQWITATGAENE